MRALLTKEDQSGWQGASRRRKIGNGLVGLYWNATAFGRSASDFYVRHENTFFTKEFRWLADAGDFLGMLISSAEWGGPRRASYREQGSSTISCREVYVTESVSGSLSRVLLMTRYEKENGNVTGAGVETLYVYGNSLISDQVDLS